MKNGARRELGEPFDITFYVLVYAIADSIDEADRKLESVIPFVTMRFEADVGVKVRKVERDELLESFKILPHPAG